MSNELPGVSLPNRLHPAHPPPLERFNQPIILMVTISLRGKHPVHCLDQPGLQTALLTSWQSTPEWQVGFYMIMPDHLHFFCMPGLRERTPVATWCRKWKSLVSMALAAQLLGYADAQRRPLRRQTGLCSSQSCA